MSKYAKVNQDGIVENVIVCDDSNISIFPGNWIKVTESTRDPHIGGEYDSENEKFIQLKPHFDSWVLNDNFDWVAPKPKPDSGSYVWNEENQEWVQVIPTSE